MYSGLTADVTPHRPHREDLLHQVPPPGQWNPGVVLLRSHSQTVEPGERRPGQNPHWTPGTGRWDQDNARGKIKWQLSALVELIFTLMREVMLCLHIMMFAFDSSSFFLALILFHAQVFSMAWSPDGKLLATVCKDGKVRIYDPRKSTAPVQVRAAETWWHITTEHG